MATVSLREEATGLLQELIRLDTVNPPGNETPAAELLRGYLEQSGVQCELYAKVPERANLVARIPGRGEGPSLVFLSHTDTVLADPAEWQLDPWSGELRDEEIWGRGALDMKVRSPRARLRSPRWRARGSSPPAISSSSRPRTRRSAPASGSPGSAPSTPTPCAPTTR